MNVFKKIISFLGWLLVIGLLVSFVLILGGIAAIFQNEMSDQGLTSIKTDHAVSVIELSGDILTSDKFITTLRKHVANDRVKGIIIQIDSPGGAVGASEEMYRAIVNAQTKKPVVCAMSSIAASGGLYAAMGCKKIFANRGTLTGSIGVVMLMPNVSGIVDKFGVGMTVIKSGKYKDAGSPFRVVTPDDQQVLQSIIDKAYEQFVQVVAQSRGLSVNDVKKFADGRIILGEEAVNLGLIDQIGGIEDAAKVALELVGDKSVPEVIYPKKKKGVIDMFTDLGESKLAKLFVEITEVQLLYRSFI